MSSNIHEGLSNSAIFPSTDDPEHILRDQDLSFRTVFNYKNPGCAGSIEQEPIHAQYQEFFISMGRHGPPPSHASWAQSVLAAVITMLRRHRKLANILKNYLQKK